MNPLCLACKYKAAVNGCDMCVEYDMWEPTPEIVPIVDRVMSDERSRCVGYCKSAIDRVAADKWGKSHAVYTNGTISEIIDEIRTGR